MPDAIELLKTRRSMKPREMTGPGPRRPSSIPSSPLARGCPITASWRHGASSCSRAMRARAAGDIFAKVFAKKESGRASRPRSRSKSARLTDAPLVIGVVSRTKPHPKVPPWEQELSAGASAMNIVTAATALGYGACWLTGWFAFDRDVLDGFGLEADEKLAGFIHIGTVSKPRKTALARPSANRDAVLSTVSARRPRPRRRRR